MVVYTPPLRVCNAELDELNIPHNWSMMEDMRGMSEDNTNLGGQLCSSADALLELECSCLSAIVAFDYQSSGNFLRAYILSFKP